MRSKSGSGSKSGSEAPLDLAKALALRVLSFHPRSSWQLRARLARAGFEGEAEEVVGWAVRLGYLDDAAYARARAGALLGPGRCGPRRIELELRRAGFSPDEASAAAAAALAELAAELAGGGPPEVTLCRAALERRLAGGDPRGLDERDRARLARWLHGRGFSGEAVAGALGLSSDREG